MNEKKEELKVGDKVKIVGCLALEVVRQKENTSGFKCVHGVIKNIDLSVDIEYGYNVHLFDYKGMKRDSTNFNSKELEKINE